MSLRLDALEQTILSAPTCKVPFYYPRSVQLLFVQIQALERKVSASSYGPKTLAQVERIINLWFLLGYVFPDLSRSHLEIVQTTLSHFESIPLEKFKYVFMGKSILIVFIDTYQLRINIISDSKISLPLRFCLACVYPFLSSSPAPQLGTLPVEVLWQTLQYVPMSKLAVLTRLNRFWNETVDSDQVWTPYCKSSQVGCKEIVKKSINRKEHRHMMQFANSTLEWETHYPDGTVDFELF